MFVSPQVNFLKSVPLLSGLPGVVLTKLGDVLETEMFSEEEHIVREGTVGDTFYILASGTVRVIQGETIVRWDIQDGASGVPCHKQAIQMT